MSGTPGLGGSSTIMSTRLAAELIIPTSRASPEPVLGPATAGPVGRDRRPPWPQLREPVHRSRLSPRAVRHRRQGCRDCPAFATDLAAHGGNPEAVAERCIYMSPSFIAGAARRPPKA